MEKGIVKFFNGAEGKQFGFLVGMDGDGNGRETFFHLNDHRPLELAVTGQIVFGKIPVSKRSPKAGDRIVFQVAQGGKGLKASPWEYEQVLIILQTKAQKIVAEQAVLYRVRNQYTMPGQKAMEPETLFEGKLKELNRRYPKPESRKYDDLASGFSCGDFDSSKWFERKEGEAWVRCNDPRTQISDSDWRRLMRA